MSGLGPGDLEAVDSALRTALRTGDHTGIDVLGYGEISTVVRWTTPGGSYACKRLPPFDDERRLEAYRAALDAYLLRLAERGVAVIETTLASFESDDGTLTAYCVQPVVDAESLAPRVLAAGSEDEARALFAAILDAVTGCVGQSCGLDAQLSNWAVRDSGLVYLDVTTPLMRDGADREVLDTDLFLASLPWALRWLVKRLMLRGILDTYYDVRAVVLDLLGNLHKEGLSHLVPALLPGANARVDVPLTAREVLAYYKDDARIWALLQRLRRADRWWQRRVRRRTYPFLLPGRIERRV